ncbi:MAG: hypothetical protein HY908_03710 [Myxococcales bacterium]|nr:hypothetical protein [Myxococcales bacterium]
MTHEETLVFASRLLASPEQVWARATRLSGLDAELGPWLSFGAPPDCRDVAALLARARAGRPPRAVLRFAGVVPLVAWRIGIERFEPGHFVERSPFPGLRVWRHDRTVRAVHGGAELVDRLTFEPRLSALARPARALVRALFAHRHARLVAWWGGSRLS